MKNLRQVAARRKMIVMKKNEEKLKHLRKKFRSDEEAKLDKMPESMKDLPLDDLSIFSKNKYDRKEVVMYETEVNGDIDLTNNERLIPNLPPKFAIEENLPPDGMALDEELASA